MWRGAVAGGPPPAGRTPGVMGGPHSHGPPTPPPAPPTPNPAPPPFRQAEHGAKPAGARRAAPRGGGWGPVLTGPEAATLALVDERSTVQTLRDLVAVPSVGGSEAEAAIQADLATRLGELGLEVDLWPLDLPTLRAHPEYPGEEVAREEAF